MLLNINKAASANVIDTKTPESDFARSDCRCYKKQNANKTFGFHLKQYEPIKLPYVLCD